MGVAGPRELVGDSGLAPARSVGFQDVQLLCSSSIWSVGVLLLPLGNSCALLKISSAFGNC